MDLNTFELIKLRHELPIGDLWNKQTYFCIEEIVSKGIYWSRGEKSIELFNENAIRTLIELRDLFGYPMNINTWKWNGQFQFRGLRPSSFYDNVSYSQHILGNAFDFDVNGLSAQEARNYILQWKKEGFLKYLTGIELDTNWVHIDCRISNRLNEFGLFLFKP